MGGKAHQGWGGKMAPSQMPNSQAASLKGPGPPQQQQQQSQAQPGQALEAGAMQGGWGHPGPPAQSQSLGWTSGPIPQVPGGASETPEPSGWEEPSPQSISRKLEIDDGTAAWGDPNNYNYKSVNLWDKNGAPSGQSHSQGPSPQQQQQQQLPGPAAMQQQQQQQQQPPPVRPSGSRDMSLSHTSNKAPPMGEGKMHLNLLYFNRRFQTLVQSRRRIADYVQCNLVENELTISIMICLLKVMHC